MVSFLYENMAFKLWYMDKSLYMDNCSIEALWYMGGYRCKVQIAQLSI